jgi:uncharacterized RDD family membrane protein YckC
VNSRTSTLPIRTPEGIVFSQVLASPVSRFLAWGLDFVCITAVLFFLNMGLALLHWVSPDLAQALSLLLYFAVSIGYAMITEWYWRGQTFGKKLLRLRVVDAQGLRLRFSQIALRNLLRAIDAMPLFYLVGGMACLVSRRAQRLGDLAAGTIVVRNPRLEQPDLDRVLAGKFNSLREYPHLEARLRQRVSPAEAALALAAVLRSDMLEPMERLQLFQELAAHLRGKVEFPAQAVEGLSDEQYVRNAVDALYRTRSPAKSRSPDPSASHR